jgi:hypothetical protein
MARQRRPKQVPDGWGINQCSLCSFWKLTIGQQKHGGVRYCQDCFRHTLAWVQLGTDGQTRLMDRWNAMQAREDVQAGIKESEPLNDPETRKAHEIGESKRRLFESFREGA